MRPSALAAALALSAVVAFPAHACFAGEMANVGRVYFGPQPEAYAWSAARAVEYAEWGARLEALLPERVSLEVGMGTVAWCAEGDECEQLAFEEGSFEALFAAVAKRSGVDPQTSGRARRVSAEPFTIEVLTTPREAKAHALADSLNFGANVDFGGMVPANFYAIASGEVDEPYRVTERAGRFVVSAGSYLSPSDPDLLAQLEELRALGLSARAVPLRSLM